MEKKFEERDIEENKAWALISYLGILCLIPLFLKKDSPFVQFHVKQGLILFIFWLGIWLIGFIPFLGWLIWFLGNIFLLILMVIGISNVLSKKAKELPLIGRYASYFKLD